MYSVPVVQSGTEPRRAPENRMCKDQELRVVSLSKTPLERYSSTGPEYEPIQITKTKRGGNQSTNMDHLYHSIPDSKMILRPASYEIPISSDTQTLNNR